MVVLISALTLIAVYALTMGIIRRLKKTRLNILERLETYTKDNEVKYMMPELNIPFKTRITQAVINSLSGFIKKVMPRNKKEALEKRLLAAGNPYGMTAESYVVFKYGMLIIVILLGISTRNILSLGLCVLIGLLIPDMYLKSYERKRQEEILKSLPDVLDLITVSVEAGLGFDAALQKVIEKKDGPLSIEFAKTLQEINMGKPRREALRDMAERVEVDDVTTFLGSIIQADQLGVSITNVLQLQSEQVRASRKMRAEETAQKAPVKILIPLVLFVFPTILIVLLGPAMIQLMDTFK